MMKTIGILALATIGANARPAAEFAAACKAAAENHGCSAVCGFEAVKAGDDHICMPSGDPTPLSFANSKEDMAEYCSFVATKFGCCDTCGYKWDQAVGECVQEVTTPQPSVEKVSDAPIIGGQGKYRYQYMPELLQMPGASLVNCHGLVTDAENNIYLTYQNDGKDLNCLIKWKPDGTAGEFMTGGGNNLCSGTPHGLKVTTEGNTQYLYHANNNQKLTKTTLDGTIIWQDNGNFGQDPTLAYRPTWFATPPDTNYTYLCDGYGSNHVYAFDAATGKYLNKTWGGKSPKAGADAPHGTFSTNHGCTYDPRSTTPKNTIVVSDRANHRFEFFHYDPATYTMFDWYKTVDMTGPMGPGTLPCNIRMYPEQDGRSIVPDLAGPVAVMDNTNTVVSIVNVSVLLAAEQHKHPHDAIFLPNGDMVVATWAPGRISYWKLLPVDEDVAQE
eukprot:m.412092 g.412092  ORF g.412092 m.412092 type:complete len:444 (-) comp28788_c0_seq1:134-1465(-)